MELKSSKLLFLYRSFLFKQVTFKTNKKELQKVVTALNIKKKKERIKYVYEQAIIEINEYYKEDLCDFKNGQCIAQRQSGKGKVNGCCRFCPIVTDKGCPSENFSCKLIYCKTALKNKKLIKIRDFLILKCLSPFQRIIFKGDFFITKETFIDDINKGAIVYAFKTIYRDLKRTLK